MSNHTTLRTQHARHALLHGNSFGWLRPQGRRRSLVMLFVLGLVAYVMGGPLALPWLTLAGLTVLLGVAVLLRITTRGVADLPTDALDERQVMVRNATYVSAYRLTGSFFAVLALVCVGLAWMGQQAVSTDVAMQVLFGCLFASMAIPSCVVAWTEQEL